MYIQTYMLYIIYIQEDDEIVQRERERVLQHSDGFLQRWRRIPLWQGHAAGTLSLHSPHFFIPQNLPQSVS